MFNGKIKKQHIRWGQVLTRITRKISHFVHLPKYPEVGEGKNKQKVSKQPWRSIPDLIGDLLLVLLLMAGTATAEEDKGEK